MYKADGFSMFLCDVFVKKKIGTSPQTVAKKTIHDSLAKTPSHRRRIDFFQESFDLEVKKLIEFMFPKLLSSSQRQAALEASWSYDLRRNNLDPGHTNSKDCEQTALKATDKMDPVLLRSLHELRERLGYH